MTIQYNNNNTTMAKTIIDQAYKDDILIYHNHTQVTISFIDETIEGFL